MTITILAWTCLVLIIGVLIGWVAKSATTDEPPPDTNGWGP